ncbi:MULTISPECIES: serine protease [unclassified Mesorhizobium]|uniref:S1 family peptidase n=1 Tax=unclassified Mesorhizobium TaxID=325217 RepID=UPI0011286953|nr:MULTISPECIES: serine protease [unclassified Mesorhizobium]TPJ86973.1 trypsin-like peptidase domain-containing protein [Mesorhizobium sp. B2-5-12]TPK19196.1 trypsin-like peptidase domain-containing protein [Mesorhizobium sp. B2-5-6]
MRILAATLLAASALCVVGCATGIQSSAPVAGSSVRIELPTSLGSGVYIGNGVIITAAHVVDGAPQSRVEVQPGVTISGPQTVRLISDQGDVQTGEVLWLNKEYDIAAIRPANARRFAAAGLACREPDLGEALVAEGNPAGVKFIQMHGYVSGDTRPFLPNWKSGFVTDMTVISGMSGGGVYDQFGAVIGITVGAFDPHGQQGQTAQGGMGFAVPSKVVCELLGRA